MVGAAGGSKVHSHQIRWAVLLVQRTVAVAAEGRPGNSSNVMLPGEILKGGRQGKRIVNAGVGNLCKKHLSTGGQYCHWMRCERAFLGQKGS